MLFLSFFFTYLLFLDATCRPAIIFRGTGLRIKESEKLQYHKDVDVYWQKKAWVDTPVAVEWVKKTFSKVTSTEEESLLLCDNLSAQTSEDFLEALRRRNTRRYLFPANVTDLIQPVDAGVGRVKKKLKART